MTEDQKKMVEKLCELDEGLRGRELDFIEDLSQQPERLLSEKQVDWLKMIHDRCIG